MTNKIKNKNYVGDSIPAHNGFIHTLYTIRNQQIELELPADDAKLSLYQTGVCSNELVAKEGQVIKI